MQFSSVSWVTILFGLAGGLALFLYGMNLMGEGLKKAAGEKLRRILEVLTGNPFAGVLVGALVTALLQSSSATTVMVIGFVGAGLMSLPQAIGVIFGANIGTTMTAQLIAFNIGMYAYPITFIGFIMSLIFKKKLIKHIGQTILGFGILFIGLNLMGDVMSPLAKDPVFSDLMLKLNGSSFLGLLLGTVMTLIVQSSSASIGVLQNLASQPVADGSGQALISLTGAIPILFGCNIGTTITAILASIGARINAKRAAAAHSIFNIAGSLLFIWFVPQFAKIVSWLSPKGTEVAIISRQIANAHSIFNILNTIIWLPFILLLAKIVTKLIPGEDNTIETRVKYLNDRMLSTPSVAMDLATKEFSRMGDFCQLMMDSAKKAFIDSNMTESKKVHEIEDTVDLLQYEIVKYLSTMLSQSALTERQSIRLAGLMHVAGDIERIADQCENITDFAEMKVDEKLCFSPEALDEITTAFNKVHKIVDDSIQALKDGDTDLAIQVIKEEAEIDDLEESLRNGHIDRLNKGLCNPKSGITYIEVIHNLERIADHCKNVAEAVLDDYGVNSSDIE